ncbi:MAG: hypothetical protein NTZ65_02840 [Candidatus Berkelbacteria bacterium]|nr:hypothetical protein [Candidatus Berkelbacteria bacterium]
MRKNYLFIFGFFVLALVVYAIFMRRGFQPYNYFLPLANAMLKGKIDVAGAAVLSELIPINGKYFVVFPPVPALLLTPAAAIWGMKFNQAIASVFWGATAVAVFAAIASHIFKKSSTTVWLTLLFAFGTNFFFLAIIGNGWYLAQVVGIFFLLLSLLAALKKKPFAAGVFLGLSLLSRLPLFLAFPAILYVLIKDNKKSWLKISLWFFVPIIAAFLFYGYYNFLRFGSFFETGYSLIPGVLNLPRYQQGIFSLSYIPRSFMEYVGLMPQFLHKFPYIFPTDSGMAVWLTTPALLLLFWVKKKDPYLIAFLLTALLIFIFDLAHGENGWRQFGMRYSLDFMIFLLIPLGFVLERTKPAYIWTLIILSILINLWGVILFHLGYYPV